MTTRIEVLSDEMQPKAREFIKRLREAGIPFAVTSTLRTADEQRALFAQGRMALQSVNLLRRLAMMPEIGAPENAYTVTNCDGIMRKSKHQYGRSMDVVPASKGAPIWPDGDDPRWLMLGEIGEACGLVWGGRWTKERDGIDPDYPHYQLA